MDPNYDSSLKLSRSDKYVKLSNMMKVEWLGQTVASLCWIISMLFYGLSTVGDHLQLCAGVAWFLANIASINKI